MSLPGYIVTQSSPVSDVADTEGDNSFTGTNKFGTASNHVKIDNNGELTLVGTATRYRDELSDAVSLQQTGPGVARNNTEAVVEFSTASNLSDYMFANVQLNHDRLTASSISPHIHFFQAENNAPNFLLQYRWQVNGGTKVTSWTNLKCNSLAFTYTSGTIHQIAYSAAISAPIGSTVSDIVQFRILRDNANTSTVFAGADPYTTTVGVLAFDVHMEIDALGSSTEYTK